MEHRSDGGNVAKASPPPRVFISYSHESDAHMRRVRSFALDLRRLGFDARLDQWEPRFEHEGWPMWSNRQIQLAQYVIIISSATYARSFIGDLQERNGKLMGKGVAWEARIIQNHVYHYGSSRIGFIPVVFERGEIDHIPDLFKGGERMVLNEPMNGRAAIECLGELMGWSEDKWTALPEPVYQEIPRTGGTKGHPGAGGLVTHAVMEQWFNTLPRLERMIEAQGRGYAPDLVEPRPVTQPDRDTTEVRLNDLVYSKEWLAYLPQPGVREALDAFIRAPQEFLWWGLLAEGGVGKTRTAYELAKELQAQGWKTGFLAGDKLQWLGDKSRHFLPEQNTLIIIDYASRTNAMQLVAGLRSLGENLVSWNADRTATVDQGQWVVRVLLLDRPGRVRPLFDERMGRQEHVQDLVRDVRRFLYRQPAVTEVVRDPANADNLRRILGLNEEAWATDADLLDLGVVLPTEWNAVLATCISQAGGRDRTLPEDEVWFRMVWRITKGRMLYLQMLGVSLSKVSGADEAERSRLMTTESLLRGMLEREIGRWPDMFNVELTTKSGQKLRNDLPFLLECQELRTLVATATLASLAGKVTLGAAKRSSLLGEMDANTRLAAIKLLHPEQADESVAANEEKTPLHGLQPDMLAEKLVLDAIVLQDGPDWFVHAEADKWLRTAWMNDAEGTSRLINLMLGDFPDHPAALAWAQGLVRFNAGVASDPTDLSPEQVNELMYDTGEAMALLTERWTTQQP